MKIAICDDHETFLKQIHLFLEKYYKERKISNIELLTFSPGSLFDLIEKQIFDYDILITDIIMNNYSGIDFAKRINTFCPTCSIIYISNYIEQSIHVYETKHVYFVLKSEMNCFLPLALEKAENRFHTNQKKSIIALKCVDGRYNLDAKDISYAETQGHKICITLISGNTLICSMSLKKFAALLPKQFVKPHNSYIINLAHVISHHPDHVCMAPANDNIPISKTFKKEFLEKYTQYITKYI